MKRALAKISRIDNTYKIGADEKDKDYVEFVAKTPFEPKIKENSDLSLLYAVQRLYNQRES